MSYRHEDGGECSAVREDLTELALGLLFGRRRSEALAHLESCQGCSTELAQLSVVADTLLQLAPEIEPPLGFEQGLAERLRGNGSVHTLGRLRRAGLLSAAALLMLILGFGLGALVARPGGNDEGASAEPHLAEATLSSQGHALGEVYVSAGKPAWIFMTIDGGTWSGPVTCQVTLDGGRVETIGQFKLVAGDGAWGAPLKSPAGEVRSAQLIAFDGTVMAAARLRV